MSELAHAAGNLRRQENSPFREISRNDNPRESRPAPATPKLGRFLGFVQHDSIRMKRDATRIAEEVVQNLTGLVGADVEITLEIQSDLPNDAGDKLVRDVIENYRMLKFTTFSFEET